MSEPNLGPVVGFALYALFRAFRDTRKAAAARMAPWRPIVTAPPGASCPVSPAVPVTQSRATLPLAWPIPAGLDLTVPVERWQREGELLAWRFWGLGRHPTDHGVRLRSFRAPWAWDGPVLRAHRLPSESPFSSAGVYALRRPPAHDAAVHWSDECCVTGWVALSGRVVEHEHGYRAERVVIRRLRLGVGTHVRVRRIEEVRMLAAELEQRYQAPVNLGHAERRFVQRVLESDRRLWPVGIPVLPAGTRV